MMFTRKELREIAPDLTRKQEDAIIDMYLESCKKYKLRAVELENMFQEIIFVLNGKHK